MNKSDLMVTRPLPKKLVERMRRTIANAVSVGGHDSVYNFLALLANIDHRYSQNKPAKIHPPDTSWWGYRVRRLKVRGFSDEHVVVKRHYLHDNQPNAEETIRRVHAIVRDHNRAHVPHDYVLKKPFAYHVGAEIIAMSHANYPSVEEVFEGLGWSRHKPTARGKKMAIFLKEKGLLEKFRNAANKAKERTGIRHDHLILRRIKKGKFVFYPLVDLI